MAGPWGRFTALFEGAGPALCLCLTQARTPDIVLVAKAAGFDAIYVDLEHSVTPLDVASMLAVTASNVGLVPLVRVPGIDPATIVRVLDGGAVGVIVPHVDSAAQAQTAVAACRFPPVGRRTPYGASPITGYRAGSTAQLIAALDENVLVVPMVESGDAVANADSIAAVDGVDMVLVGIHDLSADLGVPGETDHPDVRKAVRRVAETCAARRCHFGIAGVTDESLLRELQSIGLSFVTAGTDVSLLQHAASQRARDLRQTFDTTRTVTP